MWAGCKDTNLNAVQRECMVERVVMQKHWDDALVLLTEWPI
jgi:hypothetical protein